MKKISLIIIALVVFSLSSCKKAYECTCEEGTWKTTYAAVMPEYQADVNEWNAEEAEDVAASKTVDTDKTVTTYDKTSKAEANANCATSTTETEIEEVNDDDDEDNDNDEEEVAYTVTYVQTTDCSLEKK